MNNAGVSFHRYSRVFLVLISLLIWAPAGFGEKPPKILAVVIGISRYPGLPGGQQLQFAEHDAQSFAAALQSTGISPANIRLLVGQQASLIDIKEALGSWLAGSAGPQDTVIIFFSGHGFVERSFEEAYLLAQDSNVHNVFATAFALADFKHIVEGRIRAGRIIILQDSVRKDFFNPDSGGPGLSETFFKAVADIAASKPNTSIVVASSPGEFSWEGRRWGEMGVFTKTLIDGLAGSADRNGDGTVTDGELFRFLSDQLPAETSGKQHPWRTSAPGTEAVLSRGHGAGSRVAAAPPSTERAPSTPGKSGPTETGQPGPIAAKPAAPVSNAPAQTPPVRTAPVRTTPEVQASPVQTTPAAATPAERSAPRPVPNRAETNTRGGTLPTQPSDPPKPAASSSPGANKSGASSSPQRTLTVESPSPQPSAPPSMDAPATTRPVTPQPIATTRPITPEPVTTTRPITPEPVATTRPVTPQPVAPTGPAPEPAGTPGATSAPVTGIASRDAEPPPRPLVLPPNLRSVAAGPEIRSGTSPVGSLPVTSVGATPSLLIPLLELALDEGSLVTPVGSSAWDFYQRLNADEPPAKELPPLKSRLIEALRVRSKAVVVGDVRSDNISSIVDDIRLAGQMLTRLHMLEPDSQDIVALQKLSAAEALIALQFYDEAAKELEPLRTPPAAWVENALGLVSLGQLSDFEAERHFKRAIELEPKWAAPHYNLALLYRGQKKEASLSELEQAARVDPSNSAILAGLGDEYFERKQWNEAAAAYRSALAIRPDDDALHTKLGHSLYSQGLRSEADQEYQKAKELADRKK